MIKNLLTLLLLAVCSSMAAGQSLKDTAALRRESDSLTRAAETLRKSARGADSIKKNKSAYSADSLAKIKKQSLDSLVRIARTSGTTGETKADCNCLPADKPALLSTAQWCLVFMPLGLFLLLMIFALIGIRSFSMREALTENFSSKVTIRNPLYEAALLGLPPKDDKPVNLPHIVTIPPTLEVSPVGDKDNPKTEYRPSMSRLIALLSALVIILLAVSLGCFFIYRYLAHGCPPDFSTFTGLLLALGAGIVPYAVNKAANASAKQPI